MNIKRGDVVLAWYPFSSGTGGKRRPCLVVQNDPDNVRLANTVVAQITSNIRAATEPTQLLIKVNTPEGQQAGLLHDSLVSCNNLATIEQALIDRAIGSLPATTMTKVDECLKVSLQIA
ncbi:type II toxin-antitoxin system PemK/MazF family toxin [Fimbriiglobus ruber]|uniref:type II toxin-antitoxin system PemK/MazF family toxin n=1 Tax=Fimbriiglobus ruber TaxID=1908690 RepID=UPI000B4A8BE3|nr:type II toxin-antitoxin system PemK/MazF family toxin [Fimbriiglobus ruber]